MQAGSQDIIIVIGDMNAKVVQEQDRLSEVVGCYGIGSRTSVDISG